jgi:predicted HTH domain antitoxin
MHQLTIEYPDDLLVALGANREQFEHEARFALAAKLFELGRLSSGKAARLAGMDRVTFLLSLHRVGVAMLDLDEREMADERRYAGGE